jgi:hypothetical protein
MVRQIVEHKRASDKVPELIQLAFKLVKLAPEPQKTVAVTTGVIIQQVPQTSALVTQVEPLIIGLVTLVVPQTSGLVTQVDPHSVA